MTNIKDRLLRGSLKYIYFTFGSFVMALGVNMFLVPKKIAAGGVSGISTIVYIKFGIPMGVTYLLFNVLLFVFGYRILSKRTLFCTVYATIISSVFLSVTEGVGYRTDDVLISSIYGGVLAGVGMSIVIINGASTGGVDLFSLIVNKKYPHVSIPKIILVADFVIVVISAIVFSDYSLILYAFAALFVTNKVMDYMLDGVDIAKSAMIISDKYAQISREIMDNMSRGVTGIYTKGMYSDSERLALMCIVRKREVYRLKRLVRDIDKEAFVIVADVKEALGEGFKTDI